MIYVEKIHGSSIVEVVLYGSYARGQESDESDVDMALVLKENQTEEQYNRMASIISIEQSEFMKWKTILPFYRNVDKEGIVLWKSI